MAVLDVPLMKRGFDRRDDGCEMRPKGHVTPMYNLFNGSDVLTKRTEGHDGICLVPEPEARALDETYDGAGLHVAKIPLFLESHLGTRHDSGYQGRIEGTWWCDFTRLTFQFEHVRKCHREEWQRSEGWCALCILMPGDKGFDQIQPFFGGGWTHTIQPYVRYASKHAGPVSVPHYLVIRDPAWSAGGS